MWLAHLTEGERSRIKSNTARVFAVLLDGKWHSSLWFSQHPEVGGLQWQKRVQELRESRCGGLSIECEADPTTKAKRYRLDLSSVTDEWRKRILSGDIEGRMKRAMKRCPNCGGSGKVPRDPGWDAPKSLAEFSGRRRRKVRV